MNYCIVAFGIIVLISTLQWIFDGRKNYVGPRVTVNEGGADGEAEAPIKIE